MSSSPVTSFSSVAAPEDTLKALHGVLAKLDVTERIEQELVHLASYRAPAPSKDDLQRRPYEQLPKKRLAAVLVLVHLSPDGTSLNVTLTTRSAKLRSHPGETALPGGKFELAQDTYIEQTALREANEEVGLPLDAPLLHLTNLAPYTSRTLLIVVPCIYLLALPSSQASTWLSTHLEPNPDEVASMFECRLDRLLEPSRMPNRYKYEWTDYEWPLQPTTRYRLHSFDSTEFSSAITGLTADILIDTASIAAYGPQMGLESGREQGIEFERRAEGQVGWSEIVRRALKIETRVQRLTTDPTRTVQPN
ncbi:NUDIX hydrolase [Sporobolomyces koalae]|uniref:NUDIX hydrolase n=1 Tax=Sporobolomyces koalae TaxID=500713 RepID=UPI00317D723C